MLVLAYLALGVGLFVSNGTRPGLPYALAATALLGVALAREARFPKRVLPWVLVATCLVEAIDPLPPNRAALLSVLALAQAALGLLALARPAARVRAVFVAALGVYALTGALMIRAYPAPSIDVFDLQQGGAAALESGKNPYAVTYPNHYSADQTRAFFGDDRKELHEYPYPPLTLLLTTAAHRLGGDVRWALLAAQLGIGWLLFALACGAGQGEAVAVALATLHFLHPRGLFVLNQSWTDSVLACAFLTVLWLLQRRPRSQGALGFAIGMFAAAKQYSVLGLLLLWKDGRTGPRAWRVALVTACAVTLPLFAWSPRDFVDDVVLFQLKQPFRMDAMSLPAFVAAITGWRAPGALALVGALGAGAFAWPRLSRSLPPSRLPLATAFVYATFFLCAKQAFCNYYYAVGVFILGAAALVEPAS